MQQLNGKKPKKGPFDGKAKILIGSGGENENYNYGFKNKKCIQVYSRMVRYISGTFLNDVLEVVYTDTLELDQKLI